MAILNKSEHKTRITALNSRVTGEELVTSAEWKGHLVHCDTLQRYKWREECRASGVVWPADEYNLHGQ